MSDDSALVLDRIFYRVPPQDILKGIYLKVEAGTVCGLFGRNGSGKTTLLKVAAGQIRPSSGLTIIDGERLHKPSKWQRYSKIAYLPQETMLPPDVNVETVLRSAGLRISDVRERVASLCDREVRELSGGEKRLVEVEVVLNLERDYVLLDEPFTGVEPVLINEMCTRIENAAESGKGILVTDHYHQYVAPLAETAYLMWQKQCHRLQADGAIEDELEQIGYL